MKLEDAAPGPDDVASDPSGSLRSYLAIAFIVGVVSAMWSIGRTYIAGPIMGGINSAVNTVQNVEQENNQPAADDSGVV
jgi:hypothetical protein